MVENKLSLIVPITEDRLSFFFKYANYFMNNLPVKEIVLIGRSTLERSLENYSSKYIRFMNEDTLLKGMTFSKIEEYKFRYSGRKRRTGWYFQQFLKMAYSLACQDEYYLVWDADTIPVNKISFFEDSKPLLAYRENVIWDEGYGVVLKDLLPNECLKKHTNKSFIAEHMLIKTEIMRSLINEIEHNSNIPGELFFEKIMSTIKKKDYDVTGFSEFETYAAYVLNKYPDCYELRKWNNFRFGRSVLGQDPTYAQLRWVSERFVTISIEHFDKQWLLFSALLKKDITKLCKFSTVYMLFNPISQLIYNARMLVRSFVRRF